MTPHQNQPEPRCGKCAYIVRGVSGLQCPECGSDLREVGIRVGRAGGGTPAWVWPAILLLLWTGGCGAAAAALGPIVAGWLPHWTTGGRSATFGSPESQAYARVTVSSNAVQRAETVGAERPRTGRATVTLTASDASESTLQVDLTTGRYSWHIAGRGGSAPQDGFDAAAVRAWMAATGIDVTNPKLAIEVIEVTDVAREPFKSYTFAGTRGGLNGSTSGSWGGFGDRRERYTWDIQPSRIGLFALALLAIAVWGGGIWWIWKRRRPQPA